MIVATKGRAPEATRLMVELSRQTILPDAVIVVGATDADVAGIDADALGFSRIVTLLSDRPGASRQRNVGIERLVANGDIGTDVDSFVAFLDDDFRPAGDWLEQAAAAFSARADGLALGGLLLLNAQGTSEDEGAALIAADTAARVGIAPEPPCDGDTLYGCNMAVRGSVLVETRFDDGLPLYSWLEDADLSIKIKRRGKILHAPACRGVHLNTVGGRTSGVRFGYSQLANPIYLTRRGTMPALVTAKLMTQALAANLYHTIRPRDGVDHAGRLRGNLRALWDVLLRRDAPNRILQLPR